VTIDDPSEGEDPYATRHAGRSRQESQPDSTTPEEADPTATRVRSPHEPPQPDAGTAQGGYGAAAVGTELPAAIGTELPTTKVRPPVYKPPSRRRWTPTVVAAAIVVAAAGFGFGYIVHGSAAAAPSKPPSTTPTVTTPFLVTGAHVHLAKQKLSCPSAVARLSATMKLDRGGGTVRYDWDLLNSTITSPTSVSVPTTARSVVATLAYTLSGRDAKTGRVRLHLLAPVNLYSAPVTVRYTCS
jgi:hypothetical protein